jgi:hypothetical protein
MFETFEFYSFFIQHINNDQYNMYAFISTVKHSSLRVHSVHIFIIFNIMIGFYLFFVN